MNISVVHLHTCQGSEEAVQTSILTKIALGLCRVLMSMGFNKQEKIAYRDWSWDFQVMDKKNHNSHSLDNCVLCVFYVEGTVLEMRDVQDEIKELCSMES